MELQLLPEDLKKQKECSQILNDYISSFRYFVIKSEIAQPLEKYNREDNLFTILYHREMLIFDQDKKGSSQQLENFTETLNVIRRRHLDTVPRMATAVFKMTKVNSSEGVSETVQYFLDRLYINRFVLWMFDFYFEWYHV